jgi:hypothetical protein
MLILQKQFVSVGILNFIVGLFSIFAMRDTVAAQCAPILSATINGTTIVTDLDGADETGSFTICSGSPTPNVTMGTFSVTGATGNVKVYQEIVYPNVTQSGTWCIGGNCSALPSAFAGSTNTFTKTVPTSPASITLRFRPYVDANVNNLLDAGECAGDWAVFTVNFETQPPVFTLCPSNITLNIQRPGVCDTVATWATPPTATDLPCTIAPVIAQTAGPASGSTFLAGTTTTISYTATDAAGNVATCSFTVTVRDYVNPSLACKPVHLSLADDCKGALTPFEVLTGWERPAPLPPLLGCISLYTINVIGSNGENLGDTLREAQLGKKLNYSIKHVNGFSCWNTVLVEDKIKPTVVCVKDTISCIAPITSAKKASALDNCHAHTVLVAEKYNALPCDDIVLGYYVRTWKAVDGYKNESEVNCNDTIYLRRTDLSSLTFPKDTILSCSVAFGLDSKGFPYPDPVSSTGVPKLGSTAIYPFQAAFICNGNLDYEDRLVLNTKCKKMIQRIWRIQEWHCDTLVTLTSLPPQLIQIIDTLGPAIPVLGSDSITTQSRSCTGRLVLPRLNITDNCTSAYKVFVNAVDTTTKLPSGFVDGNGGSMELNVGVHAITYTAIDECANSRSMTYYIKVKDDTDPVALCDQFATVSLKPNGYTEITASAIDDGSYDECGPVTLKIRRMEDPCNTDADEKWADKVSFCCLDANTTRMVQLLVTDRGGNTNMCMVSVRIQNKVTPTISCPANVEKTCTFTYDPSNLKAYFGEPLISGSECLGASATTDVITENKRNECGLGYLIRTITLPDNAGSCQQRITFTPVRSFAGTDITWPKDYTVTGQCTSLGLDTAITGAPRFTEGVCDLVGMRFEDQTFPFSTNGACFKVIRTWTVIDWCQKNEDGTARTWTWEQEIKVMDRNAPVLNLPGNLSFETLDCTSQRIFLSADATDCTPDSVLSWKWQISKGSFIIESGIKDTLTRTFKIGEYKIKWTVEDRCGNVSEGSYNFTIKTKKAPTPVCKKGLAAPLVLMDTNGDGLGDTRMLRIAPEFFDNKSYHACDVAFDLSFSEDVEDDEIIFGCTEKGIQTIQLWVTDIYGNQNYCETYIDVQDTTNTCPTTGVRIAGQIAKEDKQLIESAVIKMEGSERSPVTTDKQGQYAFGSVPTGGDYNIIPSKDGDDMNGISTLDIVMIQRHILGIEKLKSPYQLIAADVNSSRSITAGDLIELRKLILGLESGFVNNTSWRFVDAAYTFTNPANPWYSDIPEKYKISKLTSDMNINFVGIKIGDVNGTALTHNLKVNTENRSKFMLMLEDIHVRKGDIVQIPVSVSNASMLYGLQGVLKSDGLKMLDIKSAGLSVLDGDVLSKDKNHVALSVVTPQGQKLADNEALFMIEVEAERDGQVRQMLSLGSDVTPEVYTDNMEVKSLQLTWRDKPVLTPVLMGTSPNPWNASTTIAVEMPKDGLVTFSVKDMTGRKIMSTKESLQKGYNSLQITRSDIRHSGVYVFEIRFEDKILSGKMIVID